MFFPHWNLKQWLVGLVISSLLGFLFHLAWKAFRNRQRELSVLPKTQSVFAVVRNKTHEIFLGDGARARHKGEFFIRLKRLAYVYLWRKMAAALRITNAKSAAEVRRLDATTMPPRVRETLRRSFFHLCRDGYQFLRNRWHGFSQWRQRCWQRFQVWRRRKRIDKLPVTNALTQRKRSRILDAAAALLRGDARWRVWLRGLPGIGRWFGSNQQQQATTEEKHNKRDKAIRSGLLVLSVLLLAAEFAYPQARLLPFSWIHPLALILVRQSWNQWRRAINLAKPVRFGVFFLAAFIWAAVAFVQISREVRQWQTIKVSAVEAQTKAAEP